MPAGAQTGEEPCPEDFLKFEPLDPGGPLEGTFVCIQGTGGDFPRFLCPEGFVEVPAELLLFDAPEEFVCVPAPGDGGGGNGGGGGDAAAAPLELTQETEQEAESGDVNQSFDVSQTGDNSNQCASPQGVANTGNPQNVIDLLQAGSEADDFEFEEVGSDITVDGTNETTCDQQVNQAASASG